MRKITGNKKGIDTILAALLMVVIVVVASVMVYAWSTGLLGALMGGTNQNVGKEALSQEGFASFINNQNVTLNLRNQGSVAVTLAGYYVKNSTSGAQYARLNWQTDSGANHPLAINPNQVGTVYITINNACGSSCSLSGNSFTFVSGFAYTILIVTSRNTQFSFTVTR